MYNEQISNVRVVLMGVVTEWSKPCYRTVTVFANIRLEVHVEQLLRVLVPLHQPDFVRNLSDVNSAIIKIVTWPCTAGVVQCECG